MAGAVGTTDTRCVAGPWTASVKGMALTIPIGTRAGRQALGTGRTEGSSRSTSSSSSAEGPISSRGTEQHERLLRVPGLLPCICSFMYIGKRRELAGCACLWGLWQHHWVSFDATWCIDGVVVATRTHTHYAKHFYQEWGQFLVKPCAWTSKSHATAPKIVKGEEEEEEARLGE